MFLVSVDLGQAADWTAIAVLEQHTVQVRQQRRGEAVQVAEQHYLLRHLERPALGTTYPAIVARVVGLLESAPLTRQTPLIVDKTGCGRPVVDMFEAAGLRPRALTITGGTEANTADRFDLHVPKRELASVIAAVYQGKRLKMAAGLELGPVLIKEVLAFRPKINIATGNVSFEAWRESIHDDLVLSVAMGVWCGEHDVGALPFAWIRNDPAFQTQQEPRQTETDEQRIARRRAGLPPRSAWSPTRWE